ncbi:MAG: thioredoxin, partial [Lysobacterales bacterium]
MSATPLVFDVTQSDFEEKVIIASTRHPVLVDFWAPWCAPCKQLTPIIEKVVAAEKGRITLAKINTDEQSQLAAIFGVRSLPTVMLIKNGQPVDGFMGAQPEAVIREWLAPHLAGIEPAADDADDQQPSFAEQLSPDQLVAAARDAIRAEPDKPELHLDLIAALLAHASPGELAEAELELDALPANLASHDQAVRARAHIEFAAVLADAPSAAELDARLAASADDHRARHQLAARQLLAGQAEAALDGLLEIMRRDRKWQDDQARKSLIAAFHLVADADLV